MATRPKPLDNASFLEQLEELKHIESALSLYGVLVNHAAIEDLSLSLKLFKADLVLFFSLSIKEAQELAKIMFENEGTHWYLNRCYYVNPSRQLQDNAPAITEEKEFLKRQERFTELLRGMKARRALYS